MTLTQDQLGCDDVSWFAHASERYDYHANHGHDALADQWRVQCELTWQRLTERERRLIAKHR
jgi:hypothetical protein